MIYADKNNIIDYPKDLEKEVAEQLVVKQVAKNILDKYFSEGQRIGNINYTPITLR